MPSVTGQSRRLVTHLILCNAPQLRVDERQQALERALIARVPRLQQLRDNGRALGDWHLN